MNPATKSMISYAALPGILPRLKGLFGTGFSHLALFMAQIYAGVGLLPAGHPYLNPANMGRFGVRHVIAQAGANLTFSKKHIDQIAVFTLMLAAFVLLFMQFALALIALTITNAHAFGPWVGQFFVTPNPTDDLAFMMLDLVFGIPNIFNSCVAQTIACLQSVSVANPEYTINNPYYNAFPAQHHVAFHAMLMFYNYGVLAIGIIVFLYYVITVTAETAESGTPFGRRFDRFWVPVRLLFCVFLLIPYVDAGGNAVGPNYAQMMTLRIAKWGSSMATNAWTRFFTPFGAGQTPLGNSADLIASPKPPGLSTILELIAVAKACEYVYDYMYGRDVEPYIINYDTPSAAPLDFMTTGYAAARNYSNERTIYVRFGDRAAGQYAEQPGQVRPTCGEVSFDILNTSMPGAVSIQDGYYRMIQNLWTDFEIDFFGQSLAERLIPDSGNKNPTAPIPDQANINNITNNYEVTVRAIILAGVAAQAGAPWVVTFQNNGWAAAGIWYNKLAELNGSLYQAAHNLPKPNLYPELMENIAIQRKGQNASITGFDLYNPYISGNTMIDFPRPEDEYIAMTLYYAQSFWFTVNDDAPPTMIVAAMENTMGDNGLFDLFGAGAAIHPLAQLVALGNSLFEVGVAATVGSLGMKGVSFTMRGKFKELSQSIGSLGSAAGMIIFPALMIGFVLGYLLPLFPFMYFFFAVGGWVKAIFEALLAVPLFALAHIRIDGNGLPGPAAMNGYFLIFEIFVRPIMISFGLLAAISIFAAEVRVLNEIWSLVTTNVTGHDDAVGPTAAGTTGALEYYRNRIDEFFYSILYTILVYLMAMTSFKLIDGVPNHILRWMGASVSSFGEHVTDPAQGLVSKIMVGASVARSGLGSLFGRHG